MVVRPLELASDFSPYEVGTPAADPLKRKRRRMLAALALASVRRNDGPDVQPELPRQRVPT